MALRALERPATVAASLSASHGVRGAAVCVALAREDLVGHLTRAGIARVKAAAEIIGERLERRPGGRARAL
jgi:hypothetical protein